MSCFLSYSWSCTDKGQSHWSMASCKADLNFKTHKSGSKHWVMRDQLTAKLFSYLNIRKLYFWSCSRILPSAHLTHKGHRPWGQVSYGHLYYPCSRKMLSGQYQSSGLMQVFWPLPSHMVTLGKGPWYMMLPNKIESPNVHMVKAWLLSGRWLSWYVLMENLHGVL